MVQNSNVAVQPNGPDSRIDFPAWENWDRKNSLGDGIIRFVGRQNTRLHYRDLIRESKKGIQTEKTNYGHILELMEDISNGEGQLTTTESAMDILLTCNLTQETANAPYDQ